MKTFCAFMIAGLGIFGLLVVIMYAMSLLGATESFLTYAAATLLSLAIYAGFIKCITKK